MVSRAPSGHERVTGAGSTQGFLQWSLAGAGIFQRSGYSQRGAQAVPACPPPWNLPTGSSFRMEEGQSGSQQGQCLARIIVLGGKQQAGWVSVLPWTGIHGKTIAGRRSHINEAILMPDFCENKGKPGCMRLLFSWGILFHRKKQCQTSESMFLIGTSFSSLGRQLNMKIIIHICDSVLLSPYTLNSLILGGSTEHSQNTRLSSSFAFYETLLPLASISFPLAYALRMNCV